MLEVKIRVNAPTGQIMGIKEDLAMYLERFGKTAVVSVSEVPVEKLLWEENWEKRQMEIGERIP